MSHSALASLTAQYTDSEGEGDASPDSQESTASQVKGWEIFNLIRNKTFLHIFPGDYTQTTHSATSDTSQTGPGAGN